MGAVWFQGNTKALAYKLVTSNRFKVTTTARPRKRTDLGQPPTAPLHVGGLMVRDPSSHGGARENYLFIMVGSNRAAQPGVEIKSTTNGTSVFSEPARPNPRPPSCASAASMAASISASGSRATRPGSSPTM